MSRRLIIAALALTFASGITLAAQNAAQVEAGKKAYDAYNCKKCHKVGEGGAKLQQLQGVATKLSTADIRNWLENPDEMTAKLKKKPVTKMKKQEFKPGEVDALMAYLGTLK